MKTLWNKEIRQVNPKWYWRLGIAMAVAAVGYVVVEVAFLKYPDFGWLQLQEVQANPGLVPNGHAWLQQNFVQIWLWTALVVMAWRVGVIVHSYVLSWKMYDRAWFLEHFVVFFWCAALGIASALLLLVLIGGIYAAFGLDFGDGMGVFQGASLALEGWLETNVPTLIDVSSYPVALLLVFLFTSLPGYFIHWLSHRSRLLWYTLHRPHHAPEILHPLASAPAFLFEYVLAFPRILVAASLTKLFYHETLVMEGALMFLVFYIPEILSHSSAHYRLAHDNFLLRNLSRLVGDAGVYHYVHHSSAREHQMVNLGGGPFNMWDRLFGTYQKPPYDPPPIGLTGQPDIVMNPLRILFSGYWHIWYELRHNHGFWVRMRILFGGVKFRPPVSREFLVKETTPAAQIIGY